MSSATYSIEARGLTKRYGGATAIQDISFTVNPGEVVGFLGPNGAGKSTTLRILSGLSRADRGEAYIDGLSVAREPERVKARIGFMPENNPLPEDLRVVEYLRFRARLKGMPGRLIRRRVEEVMEQCDLTRHARRKLIGALSKGYRQRVGVADAILAKPPVTIMDEPTIGLDPHQILQIRKLIDSMRGSTTVILSSHILAEVELSCDRVLIINHGQVVAAGAPSDLRREFFAKPHYLAEIADTPDAIRAALASFGPDWQITIGEPRPNGFRPVQILSDEDATDQSERLLAALVRQNPLRVARFERKVPTLEDIFLAATRRSWEAEQPLHTSPPRTTPVAAPPPSTDSARPPGGSPE